MEHNITLCSVIPVLTTEKIDLVHIYVKMYLPNFLKYSQDKQNLLGLQAINTVLGWIQLIA